MNNQTQRITADQIRAMKNPAEPIVCLTAYSAPVARLLDPHVDILLVGDSMGMVLYGMEDTLGVTLDMMIAHGRAVVRASESALVVVDMPRGTYEESPAQAYGNARRLLDETGAQAVKLEGGEDRAEIIKYMTDRNINVMGHIGLLPQRVKEDGGFKIKGKTEEETAHLLRDARAVESAGAFATVIEGTVNNVAEALTKSVKIPTIGIGASPACDGQVLVTDDLLGLSLQRPAKFVKKYSDLQHAIKLATQEFAADVRARRFPGLENLYGRPK
ncbi:MAG: 3-methyl-2-oxobutanoate hydroxymethyltransferase [Alphaproteobacteria bacterium]|nr:3-methyl-2-oxobutanoate hydroxymethyltransferase [Alphaproteobacteria bacterium]